MKWNETRNKLFVHVKGMLFAFFQRFRVLFTFFSKFFSSFPHGTCSLSVSPKYLDLDGYYHPFVLQSQATRLIDSHPETDTNSLNGVVTLYDTKSKKDLNEMMLLGNGNRPHVPFTSEGIKGLIWSLFIRHYWGNHSYFLFLRLIICLNSAGSLIWAQLKW